MCFCINSICNSYVVRYYSLHMQLTYSPRVISGSGLTDGEAMERLWAYLRRFAKCTKEMRPSHRIDVLTSALLHYASRVHQNIGMYYFILLFYFEYVS